MILSFSILKIRIFSLFEYDSEKIRKSMGSVRGGLEKVWKFRLIVTKIHRIIS